MRLVGASDFYIQAPFILEGTVRSGSRPGLAVALLLLFGVRRLLSSTLSSRRPSSRSASGRTFVARRARRRSSSGSCSRRSRRSSPCSGTCGSESCGDATARWPRAALATAVFGAGVVAGHLRPAASGRSRSAAAATASSTRPSGRSPTVPPSRCPASVLQRAAVQGMLKALGDPCSAYYEPTDYAQFQQVLDRRLHRRRGLGPADRAGALRVISVRAGLAGRARRPASRATRWSRSTGTPVAGRTVADVVSGLRGTAGTDVSRRGTARRPADVRHGCAGRDHRPRRHARRC